MSRELKGGREVERRVYRSKEGIDCLHGEWVCCDVFSVFLVMEEWRDWMRCSSFVLLLLRLFFDRVRENCIEMISVDFLFFNTLFLRYSYLFGWFIMWWSLWSQENNNKADSAEYSYDSHGQLFSHLKRNFVSTSSSNFYCWKNISCFVLSLTSYSSISAHLMCSSSGKPCSPDIWCSVSLYDL